MPNLNRPATLGMNLFMIRLKEGCGYQASYIWAFLNSALGVNVISRKVNGTVPLTIDKDAIRTLCIPRLSSNFQSKISELVAMSENHFADSSCLYKEAEQLLLKELGLEKFKPENNAVNIKSLSKSFGKTGRLDAEYYQKKYDLFFNTIKDYKNGYSTIAEVCNLENDSFSPDNETRYKYIELSNIGNMGNITGCTLDNGENLPSRARRKVKYGDIIISSIEGSLGSIAKVDKNFDQALCSTGFYVLRSTTINPETLLVLFKSRLVQNILKRACSGTILTSINKDDFLKIIIPIIKDSVQSKVFLKVRESFQLREKSEELLNVAKEAVEMAIEKGEVHAIEFIKTKKAQEIIMLEDNQ